MRRKNEEEMIIKNGFLKTENGAWVQLIKVSYVGVCQVKPLGGPDYYTIGFRIDGNEEEFVDACNARYSTKEEAHAALDEFIINMAQATVSIMDNTSRILNDQWITNLMLRNKK